MGEVRVPATAKWQAQTQRAVENFPVSGRAGAHRRWSTPWPASRGPWPPRTPAAGGSRARWRAAVARRRRRGARRAVGRPVPGRRLPDRLRHQHEHERQRGAGHPGDRLRCRQDRPAGEVHPNDDVNAPAVVERPVPGGHPPRRRRPDRRPTSCRRSPTSPPPSARQDGGHGRRREGRAHPPHGRHAGHARPGDRRLRHPGRAGGRPPGGRARAGSASCPSAAAPSAPASTCPPATPRPSCARLARETRLPLSEAADHIAHNASRDALVEVSGLVRVVAIALGKCADDIRWMGSGPSAGLGELHLPTCSPAARSCRAR